MITRTPVLPPEHVYPIDDWRIVQTEPATAFLLQDEALFSVSNGYLGIRGTHDEGRPIGQAGTFVNGFHETWPIPYGEEAFGFAKTGQTMLSVADATVVRLYVDDEPLFLPTATLVRFMRALDMRAGLLERDLVWETPSGKHVAVRSRRLVSLEHRHLAAIAYDVTVLDADAPIAIASEVRVGANTIARRGDPRQAKSFEECVLLPRGVRGAEGRVVLGHQTQRSGMTIACGVEHVLTTSLAHRRHAECGQDGGLVRYTIEASAGEPVRLVKLVAYHTSRSAPAEELMGRAELTLDRAATQGFDAIADAQRRHLADFWERSDLEVAGVRPRVQQVLRFNLFQLYQAAARAEGVGVGARGLTGPAYDGHYFWDMEMYVLPFLIYTAPRIARNLLRFRHSMLDQARQRARDLNQRGALFPWRTINGEEASAYYAAGTAQYHIDAAIAYAIRKYVQVTGDTDFLEHYGAEILVETARLWEDLGFYSERQDGRFCIHGVTGPDEYNTVVDNNTYTNLMARENLWCAAATVEWLRRERPEGLRALVHRTGLRDEEVAAWRRAGDHMYVPFDERVGIHPQDDAFLDREPWDFANTPPDRYPLLLHFHPLVIYRHRVIKQADIVLAMFVLGNEFTLDQKRRNFDYYDPLTTGDSSLSACIQAILAAELGYLDKARDYLTQAAVVDLADAAGNVRDGCHIASMGGTWMAAVYGFAGLRDHRGQITFDPRLPSDVCLRFALTVRGQRLVVRMAAGQATYHVHGTTALEIVHQGMPLRLEPEHGVTVPVTLPARLAADRFDAVLFDLDGVLTETARTHAGCWKRAFDEFLARRAERTGETFAPFDVATDYPAHVDGRLRVDGVRAFLASRGITLPLGDAGDAPGDTTLWAVGNRKNALYQEAIREGKVEVYASSVALVRALRARGLRTAVVSASRNCRTVLAAAAIADLFDVVVDGEVAAARGLAGKPAADTFLAAAAELGVPPGRAIVVEDAVSGVEAGRAGGFGLVVGVARKGDATTLREHGADVVVHDLAELGV